VIETLGTLYRQAGHEFPPVQQRSESLGTITGAGYGTGAYETLTFGAPTYTGRSVTPNTALAYSALWCCVNGISKALATCNLFTYRNLSPDGLTRELATDDYRYRLLREQPNPEMSSAQWRLNGIASLLTWGNWYSFLDLDGRGRTKAIWFLRPDWIIPMRNIRTLRMEYHYRPLYPYANPVPAGVYDADQILHIAGLGYDGIVGYSPVTMFRNAIALGQAQEEQGGRFIAGGGTQKVALVAPTGTKVSDPDAVRAEWKKRNGGLENSGEVAILHGGMEPKTFGIPPRDAQFLEGRSWQISEFARIYDYPLGMLYDGLAKPETYATAEQYDLRFTKHTCRPWAGIIEAKINTTVLSSQDALTCEHDLYDLQRGDLKSQMDAFKSGVTGMVVHPNEARGRLRLPPDKDPGADQLWGQGQMMPISTLRAAKQKPATPQQAPEPPQK
jgi:HK97 family phage portal protein